MQRNNAKLLIGLLGAVVIASGCTNTGSGTSVSYTPNTGVTIDEFTAFPTDVFGGDTTDLTATVTNTGEQEARSVTLEVTNVPFSGSNSWSNTGGSGSPTLFGGESLDPGNPDTGVPPSPLTDTAEITSPDLEQGITIDYEFVGELSYDYRTVGISDIRIVSEDVYRQQQLSRGQPSIDNTAGPVTLGVRSSTPFIVDEDGGTVSSPLCVTVTNSGSGVPTLEGAGGNSYHSTNDGGDTLNKVELSVNFGDLGSASEVVDLRGNQGVHCFSFGGSDGDLSEPSQDQVGNTYPVQITANYRYEKETSTSVTVQGEN